MKAKLGPWATAINVGPNPQLSAFWKRRMTMLVPASRSRFRISRWTGLSLIITAVAVCVVPTFRASPALAEKQQETPHAADVGQSDPDATSAESSTLADADSSKAFEDFIARMKRSPGRKINMPLVNVSRNPDGQVTGLELSDVHLQPEDFPLIGKLRDLQTLDLAHTNVTDEELRHLRGLVKMRELNLWDTDVTGSGVRHLGALDRLVTLNLGRAKATDDHLHHLEVLEGLRYLALNDNNVTDEGLKVLGELRRLEALKLGDTKITDAGLRHLEGLKNLRSLTLDGTNVTDEGVKYLAKFPKLGWISSLDRTVEEFIRRVERGEHRAVDEMTTVGLRVSRRGRYQLEKLQKRPLAARDRRESRMAYYLQMQWFLEPEDRDETFYATLLVYRGAVRLVLTSIVLPQSWRTP